MSAVKPICAGCVLALVVASCRSASPSESDEGPSPRRQHLSLLGGGRELLDSDWNPAAHPAVVGIEYDIFDPEATFGLEAGFSLAFQSTGAGAKDETVEIAEYSAGLRRTFSIFEDHVHPYLAAGPALVHGSQQFSQSGVAQPEQRDTSWGVYARAGVYLDFGSHWTLGVDARELFLSRARLVSSSTHFDYRQLALTLGYSF